MARAGWPHRVVRAGRSLRDFSVVAFATPEGTEERREVVTGMLPNRDLVAAGLLRARSGKTARDHASESRGKSKTGHSAIPGPAKGPSGHAGPAKGKSKAA